MINGIPNQPLYFYQRDIIVAAVAPVQDIPKLGRDLTLEVSVLKYEFAWAPAMGGRRLMCHLQNWKDGQAVVQTVGALYDMRVCVSVASPIGSSTFGSMWMFTKILVQTFAFNKITRLFPFSQIQAVPDLANKR